MLANKLKEVGKGGFKISTWFIEAKKFRVYNGGLKTKMDKVKQMACFHEVDKVKQMVCFHGKCLCYY